MIFYALSGISALLIVAGFLVPPTGVIDPSVFTGVGELFAFAALDKIPEALRRGGRVKINKGNTNIELHGENQQGEEGEQ